MTGNDSVICCIMMDNCNFLMVKQYRPNLEVETIEFTAGGIEKNESHLEAAKREISEETGYECDLLYLGAFRLLLNRTNTNEHLYFCINPKIIPNSKVEKGIKTIEISRKKFKILTENGNYFQLAGLGILHLISMKLKIDIMTENIKKIKKRFYNNQQ